jgi:hypothetical protein
MVGCPYLDGPSAGGVCWQACSDALARGEWRICCNDPHTENLRREYKAAYIARFGYEEGV